MSERMTVEGEALTNEHCGFCGLHYGVHPRYKSLEHLARAVARDREAHEWMPPSTYAAVKQAILDEGLKEYQARVDGLVEALAREVEFPDGRCKVCEWSQPCDPEMCMYAPARAALAAVREYQVSEGGV